MEITNENKEEVFKFLEEKGQCSLINHIKNSMKINEENYGVDTEYSGMNGYGAVIHIMKEIPDYIRLKIKCQFECEEILEEIKEDNISLLLYCTFNKENTVVK